MFDKKLKDDIERLQKGLKWNNEDFTRIDKRIDHTHNIVDKVNKRIDILMDYLEIKEQFIEAKTVIVKTKDAVEE